MHIITSYKYVHRFNDILIFSKSIRNEIDIMLLKLEAT